MHRSLAVPLNGRRGTGHFDVVLKGRLRASVGLQWTRRWRTRAIVSEGIRGQETGSIRWSDAGLRLVRYCSFVAILRA